MTLLLMVPINPSMHLLTLLTRDMDQTGAKLLLILARVEAPKFLIPIKASGYLMASWQACHAVGDYFCDISSILVPLGLISMSTATALNVSLP